jgi:hypothetical protein
VTLKDLLNDVSDRSLGSVGTRVVVRYPSIVERESTFTRVLEEIESVGSHFDVILNILEHEPRRISRVVTRSSSRIEEIRNETVLEDRTERQDMISSGSELTSDEEETSKRNENVSSPSSCPLFETSQVNQAALGKESEKRKLTPAVK